MSVSESKINNIEIEVLNPAEEFTPNSVKGYDYFHFPYNNTCICAKKNSGKSMLIYNIIKNTIDKRTKVIIMSGSVHADNVYKEIIKYLKKKEIDVKTYTNFIENRVNIVTTLLNAINKEDDDDDAMNDGKPRAGQKIVTGDITRPKRKKKPKKIVPDYLLIFDDLGSQLRAQTISTLTKVHRHNKIRCIFSFHTGTDVLPATTQQCDYFILFGGYPEERLEQLYKQLVLSVNFDEFLKLYNHATTKKFDFLYIDVRRNQYRRNFNHELSI